MHLDLWERVESILNEALQLPFEERLVYVERAGAGDQHLIAEVRSLLDQFDEDPTFLEKVPFASAPDSEPEADAGIVVGGYHIIRPIARGGMGQVYLASRGTTDFRQYVALKVLRRGLDTEDVLRRFAVERRIQASLSHPNIARFLDGGATDEGLPFFVMEYVEGLPITGYSAKNNLSVEQRLGLFRTVCAAVQFAHRNLVVHRDLKPSNILVTREGVPKLLDFGIAKILDPDQVDPDQPLTRTEIRVLTPDYAAPEQVLRAPITTAADVYSLGVLLFELLTGDRPYRLARLDVTEMERVVREQGVPLPSGRAGDPRLRRRLEGDLDTIVATALKKDPARRYVSVEQLSEDVRRYLHGLPIVARPDTVGYRLRKFAARHRLGVAAGVIALIVLTGFAGAMVWQNARVEAQAAEAMRERDLAREVSDFLVHLFESTDPTELSGADVSARDLLERGVQSVEQELTRQPQLQAEMMAVLGRVYASMGQFQGALKLSSEALNRRRALLPAGHPDIGASLHGLGMIFTLMSRYPEAEDAYEEALAIRVHSLGENHVDVATTLRGFGWLLVLQGRYAEADSLLRRALAISERVLGGDHPDVAETLNNLGILERRRGNLEAASRAHARAMDIRRRTLGEQHRWYAQSLNNLAIVREELGDHETSATLLSTAIGVLRRILGDDHPDVVLYMSNLAKQRYHVGRYDDADSLFRRVLDLQRRILGERHVDIALTLMDLGQIEHRRGNLDAAEKLFLEALEMRRLVLGEEHHEVGFLMNELALLAQDRGRPDLAEAHFREALRISRDALPERHYRQAHSLLGLGGLLCAEGRASEGKRLLREAWDLRREAFGEEDARTSKAAEALEGCAA